MDYTFASWLLGIALVAWLIASRFSRVTPIPFLIMATFLYFAGTWVPFPKGQEPSAAAKILFPSVHYQTK